jgi:hypothetical protein
MAMEFGHYRWARLDFVIQLLRPGAKFSASQTVREDGSSDWSFSEWEDARPVPSREEILDAIGKVRALEDSVKTIYTDEQKENLDAYGVI